MLYKAEVYENGEKDPFVTYYIRKVNIVEAAIAAKMQLNKDIACKHKDKKLRVAKIEELEGNMI